MNYLRVGVEMYEAVRARRILHVRDRTDMDVTVTLTITYSSVPLHEL
jgi:hypothetical protein